MVLSAILLIVVLICFREYLPTPIYQTSSSNDKAAKIIEWFSKTAAPTYIDYRSYMNLSSNIVEYETAMRLQQQGKLTLANLQTLID